MSQYAPYVPHQHHPWRDNRRLVRFTVAALVAQAAAAPLQIWNLVTLRDHYRDYLDGGGIARLDSAYLRYNLLSAVASLASIAGIALLVALSYRLAKNHEAIGRPGTRFGPGWAIGGWFIPLASSVIPYLVLVDISKGCDADEAPFSSTWKQRRADNEIYAWWALELFRSIIGIVFAARLVWGFVGVFQDLGRDDATAQVVSSLLDTALGVQIAVQILTALTQLVGAYAVFRLVQKQDSYARAHRLEAPAYAPAPAAWHADPSGRHEHRYWDGLRWTEHVADNGVGGIDPPT
jgi:hypothetical protein